MDGTAPARTCTPCCTAWLKLENKQATGSFKARGAANKVFSLSEQDLDRGLVTSSTGNHALAFIHACQVLSKQRHRAIAPLIYLPKTASPAKADKLRQQGAELLFYGMDCVEAELEARRVADAQGMVYVSPYNDLQVAAGQGTIAVELLQRLQHTKLDVVFVPVGGGGLISGIAAVLKSVSPNIQVVGCQPAASDVMTQSVRAGQIVDVPSGKTLSDGTAGGIEPDALTLEPCMRFVDQWVTVTEPEIAAAMLGMQRHHGMDVEGAAGVSLAAFCKLKSQLAGKYVVVVCCGGNDGSLVARFVRRQEQITLHGPVVVPPTKQALQPSAACLKLFIPQQYLERFQTLSTAECWRTAGQLNMVLELFNLGIFIAGTSAGIPVVDSIDPLDGCTYFISSYAGRWAGSDMAKWQRLYPFVSVTNLNQTSAAGGPLGKRQFGNRKEYLQLIRSNTFYHSHMWETYGMPFYEMLQHGIPVFSWAELVPPLLFQHHKNSVICSLLDEAEQCARSIEGFYCRRWSAALYEEIRATSNTLYAAETFGMRLQQAFAARQGAST
ncbi:hypothetical protein WJX72_007688 [[Myrmecia] bisecta]|uniref:Tryptophan synthase beta chain-like PALP domain-containing protein n=1 Tax=[Myrmecia] bisecta TaxID=41462 RepID=A0AAW1R6Y3_9CHLO